jgi:hypothetical protein
MIVEITMNSNINYFKLKETDLGEIYKIYSTITEINKANENKIRKGK